MKKLISSFIFVLACLASYASPCTGNAGSDQTVCHFSLVTLAGHGGNGTWTALTTNPDTVTFTNPNDSSSTAVGFNAGGAYYLVWSVAGCDDTVKITVTAPNAGPNLGTCLGTPINLAATGAGSWSKLSTNPTNTQVQNSASPTTLVRNFNAYGQYGFVWTSQGCKDTTYVQVSLKPNAGPDLTVCQNQSINLAGVDSGRWANLPSNSSIAVIDSPTSPTSLVHALVNSGTYGFVWSNHGCPDTMNLTVTLAPNAGPDQSVCQFATVNMAANGGNGTWTQLPGNPAVVSLTSPSSPLTRMNGFNTLGLYGFAWATGPCQPDTVYVTVSSKPDAGPDVSNSCASRTSVTLAAVDTPGVWTAFASNPIASTITTTTDPHSTVTGMTTPGTYNYVWTVHGCTDTVTATIGVIAQAGPDQTICQYSSTTMAGNGASGTWAALSGNPATVTFANALAPATAVTGFTAAGVYSFTWSTGPCPADTMTITVTPKPNAGPDVSNSCASPTAVTFAAVSTPGVWTSIAGNPGPATFTTATSPTTSATGLTTPGTYYFAWTVNGCPDTVIATIGVIAQAGADQTICQYSTTTLSGNGASGTWAAQPGNPAALTFANATQPGTSVSGFSVPGAYTLTWATGPCPPDTMIITVTAKPNAGPDIIICQGLTATMAATGTGQWAALAGNPSNSNFSSSSSPTTTVSGLTSNGIFRYTWTNTGCSDTMNIFVSPAANAGPDMVICARDLPMMVGNGSAGQWTALSGNPAATTFTNPTSPNTYIAGLDVSGVYRFVWTIGTCGADTMNITVRPKPNAGPDTTLACFIQNDIVLNAIDSGVWSTLTSLNPAYVALSYPRNSQRLTLDSFQGAGVYYILYTSLTNTCTDTVIVTANSACNCPHATAYRLIDSSQTPVVGDTFLECETSTCVKLKAKYFNYGTTDSYTVSPINYTPYTYSGGNPFNLHQDDEWSTAINIPFCFKFFDTVYNTIWLGSNGVVTFTDPQSTYCPWSIANGVPVPSASPPAAPNTIPKNSIMGPYMDIYPFIGGAINWKILDQYPCRKFVISFDTIPMFSCTTVRATSQIVFYETTNVVDVFIKNKPLCTGWNNGYAIEGIQNSTGNIAYTVPGRNNGTSWSATNDAWRFTPVGRVQQVHVSWYHNDSLITTLDTATYCVQQDTSNVVIHTFKVKALSIGCAGDSIWQIDSLHAITVPPIRIIPTVTVPCSSGHDTATLTALRGFGVWSALPGNPSPTTIAQATNPITTVTGFTSIGAYRYLFGNGNCGDTATINVTLQPDAGPDQSACVSSGVATMAASGTSGMWTALSTNPPGATITNINSPTTTITGMTTLGAAYNFVWTISGTCTDTAKVIVVPNPNPGPAQTICQYNTVTTAAVGSGGIWSALPGNPAATSIANPTSANATISGFTVAGVYQFQWSVGTCADTLNVTVNPGPYAGPDQIVCPNATATMAATGVGSWFQVAGNPSTATITTPSSASTTITGLSAFGVYKFIWTASGCSDSMFILVSPPPTVTLRDTNVCIGDSVTISPTVAPTGGTYLWSNGAVTSSIRIAPTVPTLYRVTYSVGVCSTTASDSVRINPLPVVTVTTDSSICTANNGQAMANTTIGTAPYTYLWTGGGVTNPITGLAPTSYTVTVTDAHGCKGTGTGTVPVANHTVPITLNSIHNLNCYHDSTGAIYITAVGTGPITYLWSDNSINRNLIHVPVGAYSVAVTDSLGCTGFDSYLLTEPLAPITISSFNHTDPLCAGAANGSGTVFAAGGSGAYHYLWQTVTVDSVHQTVVGILAGTYTAIVTDDSACRVSGTVILTDPARITFLPAIVVQPRCHGGHDGTAQTQPQNGIGTYTYVWDTAAHSQTINIASGLGAGTYTVTATDANGCQGIDTITVGEPSVVGADLATTNVTCYGANNGTATATGRGGTPPYSYHWSDGQTTAAASNLAPLTYIVIVTDSKGCDTTASITITQPDPLVDTLLRSSRTKCLTSSDGSITVLAKGGSGTITYSVQDGNGVTLQSNTTGQFEGLSARDYTVLSTDANGCAYTATIAVPFPEANVYTSYTDSTSCYGTQYKDGIIHVQGHTIPNGPYQFSVDNSPLQSIPDFFDQSAGSHIVRAVDNYGCDTTFTVVVGAPLPASIQILPGDSTLAVGSSLQLSTVFGPYSTSSITSYYWTPSTGLSCIDCPNPVVSPYNSQTTYSLVVTYNKGCETSTTIKISVHGEPPLYIPNGFTPNGDGNNDVFYIFGVGVEEAHVTIFNRWGEMVFESSNQNDGWDGTFQGSNQPPGIYTYYIEVTYLNNRHVNRQGSLTLIR